jgi:hypothetical protein
VDAVGAATNLRITDSSTASAFKKSFADDDSGAIYGKWKVTHRVCLQTDCDDLEANPTNGENSKSYLLTLVNPCRERAYSLRGDTGTAAQPVDITFDEFKTLQPVEKHLDDVVQYADGDYDGFSGNCAIAEWKMNTPVVTACKSNDDDSDSTCQGQVNFDATALTVVNEGDDPNAVYKAIFNLEHIDQGIFTTTITWTAVDVLEIGTEESRNKIVTGALTVYFRVNKCLPYD